ncbi:MAG: N-6 DNA methylase [Polyangiaceae bacterium]|nr:N-6 DNA methylase [Polyangiaceae bacterium]
MPLSWNEIRNRAHAFSKRWEAETSEQAESKPFWIEFFQVFGIDRRRVASFEEPVKKLGGQRGFIDLFWKGTMLVEQKSRGKNLDKAFTQALDYFPGIKERDLPKYILVSDFARFRLYNLEEDTQHEFPLAELHKNIKHFGFMAGYRTQVITPQNPVNIQAAECMGKLHDALKASNYIGHPLEVILVRLLFCLFAEDTGIFQPAGAFRFWIEERTAQDGSDLGPLLASLFQTLNTPERQRSTHIDEHLANFPFVNGKLFEEVLPIAGFNAAMREALLDCCSLDWGTISPAIFAALFQSVMDAKARRNLGTHYTSEGNILKLIKPLFLDDLRAEFERVKRNRGKLFEFRKKLRTLTFFDPACGCGNFLVIAYRELRLLELDVLRVVFKNPVTRFLDVQSEIYMDVDQFYGIEIEEFPAQIAQVALWLADHQMNVRISEEFGLYFARIPLKTSPHIVHDNALTLDWNEVLPSNRAMYVFGNPPFVGGKYMNDAQRKETRAVFAGIESSGLLDYVAAWYVKAANYLTDDPLAELFLEQGAEKWAEQRKQIRCAFVSTNSVTQGEQVGVLWGWLLSQGIRIQFAHRTFQWSNEARGVAAVHCVIIGFGLRELDHKIIYEYEGIRGEAQAVVVSNISPYLADAPNCVLLRRSEPISNVPRMGIGNKPIDRGHYLFSDEEKVAFLAREPTAKQFFRRWVGAEEFINGVSRWCLWLGDVPPEQLRDMPLCLKRVDAVRRYRLASKSLPTQKLAQRPTRFHVELMPSSEYMAIPTVSSERREYIPIGYLDPSTLASDRLRLLPDANLVHFATLCSSMHVAWTRAVCGRLESRYLYSIQIVYNNYPWPDTTDKQRLVMESTAEGILDARAKHPQSTLADWYDPLTMPQNLRKAHAANDRAVDAAYRYTGDKSDAPRVAFLFDLYGKTTRHTPSDEHEAERTRR